MRTTWAVGEILVAVLILSSVASDAVNRILIPGTVVEHLCRLQDLPEEGSRFFAVPVKVKAFGTFPVRAFGLVEEPA